MFMVPTEGFFSNAMIPNDLSGDMRESFVLPDHLPQVKRIRVKGVFTSHQVKRAPHLLQADAVESVKRMRLAKPLPLSAFLSTSVQQSSDCDFSFVQPEHTQTDAAGFSSTAASSQSIVHTVSSLSSARRQSSSGTIASDIYDG